MMSGDAMSDKEPAPEEAWLTVTGSEKQQGIIASLGTEGQYQPVKPQVNNQRSLPPTHQWAIPATCKVQKDTERSNIRPDKNKILQAQGTVDGSNHTPNNKLWKEDKTTRYKMHKKVLNEAAEVAAVILEREISRDLENSIGESGKKVDPLTVANFEFKATNPHVVLQNVEDGGPLMGFSKDYLCDKIRAPERNNQCEQTGPRHLGKVYSRSRGCRKKLDQVSTAGLVRNTDSYAQQEVII